MKTGKVKNVAAFGKLVGMCNDLGARYNPSKAALTPTALATLLEDAQNSLEAVNVARANYVLAINSRQEKYAGVYPLAQRLVRALAASEGSVENIRDARLLRNKLVPKPKSKIVVAASTDKEAAAPKISNSSSRLDFDGKVDTFAQLIKLLQGIAAYAPNEPDLQLTSLTAMLADLQSVSKAVATTGNALANARINRNNVVLGKGGVYETGTAVKEYLRSVFGVRSDAAKELGKLRLAA